MKQRLWPQAQLDELRQVGDPLADEAVGAIIAEKGLDEARHLFDQLIRNIELPKDELPDSLQAFWEATNQLPDWADWERIQLANDFFLDHGHRFLVFLYYKSLPILYSCAKGAEVLIRTGRLAHGSEQLDVFSRRIAETGQFLMNVMAPEALKPGGIGIQAIQKVRLIHAAIRHFVGKSAGWKKEELGVPVNQEDMAITLQTFSSVPLQGIEQLGIVLSAEEKENYYHCWRGIGSLMGVNEELLPATQDEGFRLHQQILDRQGATSAAGHQLTQALLRFAEATIPKTILDDAPEALIRYLVGPDTTQLLGVTPPQGCLSNLFPHALGKFFAWGEKLEDRSLPFSSTMDIVSRQLTLAMVNFFNEYKQTYFRIPESMQVAWDIASSGD
jgi:hypothetical protein